jgi:hypothetical protein
MTDRGDAEFLQIIGGQFRQQFWPDMVLCECGRVLPQPQAPQPRRNPALPGVEPLSLVGFKLAPNAAHSVIF